MAEQKRGKPGPDQLALLKSLRRAGRARPIDVYERAHGPVTPASRGGVASATAGELKRLMADGYVNASYDETRGQDGTLYHLTAAGRSQAGSLADARPTPPGQQGKPERPGKDPANEGAQAGPDRPKGRP